MFGWAAVVSVTSATCAEPDTTPPINSAESVSPLKIIFTSEVSETAKLVLLEISIEDKVATEPNPNVVLAVLASESSIKDKPNVLNEPVNELSESFL